MKKQHHHQDVLAEQHIEQGQRSEDGALVARLI
jgi:hypothetical protein